MKTPGQCCNDHLDHVALQFEATLLHFQGRMPLTFRSFQQGQKIRSTPMKTGTVNQPLERLHLRHPTSKDFRTSTLHRSFHPCHSTPATGTVNINEQRSVRSIGDIEAATPPSRLIITNKKVKRLPGTIARPLSPAR
jgi:hypothetical protein